MPKCTSIKFFYVKLFVPDINECNDVGLHKCGNGTRCINTRGGYECLCIGHKHGEQCQYGKYIYESK